MRRLAVASPVVVATCLAVLSWSGLARAQSFTAVSMPDIAAHVSFSTGVTWVDIDRDGDLDLYVTTGFAADNANVLYRNDAGTFVRVTGVPVTLDGADTACSAWADFDNDGDVDAFVSNLVAQGGMLFSGVGGGALELNTTAGVGGSDLKGTGCAWGDYDNDGSLDLVVAALFGQGGITTPNHLFHNDGDGTFTEVASGPLATTTDTHHHPTWCDYDSDGDLDLFFATGPVGSVDVDRMYRNQLVETGSADFTPITTAPIATDARDSQVLSWVDADDDGDFDLYAVNYTSVPNQLYRNDGGGTFTKITTGTIVTDLGANHGVVWGDFDNDGDQDAYVARDNGQSNRYYRNDGGLTFTRITSGAIVTEARSNYGVAAGDYDRDGDLDLFLPTARSEGPSQLYRNDLATGAHWLEVRLTGTVSNRDGVGAKLHAFATLGGNPRRMLRELRAGTSYGGHDAVEAHFGLADAAVIDTLRIEWPSGIVDRLYSVPVDTLLDITEGATLDVGDASPRSVCALTCAPNPWRHRATLSLTLDAAARVTVDVLDIGGRRVAQIDRGTLPAGTHAIAVDRRQLVEPGLYLVRVRTGTTLHSGRMVVLESRN